MTIEERIEKIARAALQRVDSITQVYCLRELCGEYTLFMLTSHENSAGDSNLRLYETFEQVDVQRALVESEEALEHMVCSRLLGIGKEIREILAETEAVA